MAELITWHPAAAPPDTDRSVLVTLGTGLVAVWIAWWDGLDAADGPRWIGSDGETLTDITYWADLPKGPAA